MIEMRTRDLFERVEKLEAEVADLREQLATKAAPKAAPKGGRSTGGGKTSMTFDGGE